MSARVYKRADFLQTNRGDQMKATEKKTDIDPNRVLDRSQNMDRNLDQDPGTITEGKRQDGVRPEDQENQRQNEQQRRRENDADYSSGEDRQIHTEFERRQSGLSAGRSDR